MSKKPATQPTRCEQLGVCQAHGTCTRCLVASMRHPYAPGVIESPHVETTKQAAVLLGVASVLMLVTLGLILALGFVDLSVLSALV